MTGTTVSFYRLADGRLTGQTFTGLPERIESNTPEGCAAFEGLLDHLSQAVDLATGEPCDWQPEPPADDEYCRWEWSDKQRRWVGQPTLAALKRDAAAPLLDQLATLDQAAIRPIAEISLALGSATDVPADAKVALAGIEAQKQALRLQLRAIQNAADAKEVSP